MSESLLKTIKLGETDVTRLIVGGNTFSGNSHVNSETDEEMRDYFTTQRVKDTLAACLKNGINTAQMRADQHIARILREFRLEGNQIHWIAQSASEMSSFEGNINSILYYDPISIYLHGSITDELYKEGNIREIKNRLEILRRTGKPAGLCSHMPEILLRAEEENWGADWYMCCVYNLSRMDRVSSDITGIANFDEPFFDEDIPVMYKTIQQLPKTCMAFKILGSTRRCGSPGEVENAFKEAFDNIKPTDGVIVGMFPKYSDQVKENCDIVRKITG